MTSIDEKILNPNGSLKVPEWIKEDLFQSALGGDIPNYSKITKFTPVAAIGPGENYTSTMLRVHIDVELKDGSTSSISYVVKTVIESSETRELVDSLNCFIKEMEFYQNILPAFDKLYTESGQTIQFGPSSRYVKDTPDQITIIMEDLGRSGFANVDRIKGLDMFHMTSVLRKLAQFHAASAVYYERIGPFPKPFQTGLYAEDVKSMVMKFGIGTDEMFKKYLTRWGDCEKYIDIWPDPERAFKWFIEYGKADPDKFNVLNHGDCWSNNIMFQHNNKGEVTETYFVDYQLAQWSNPGLDLWYLIIASAQYELRVKEFGTFLRIYHEELAKQLKLLKYSKSILSLKDINIMMINTSLWGFNTGITALATVLVHTDQEANMDNFVGEDEASDKFREAIYMNPEYIKAMKQLLPWWENMGMFEF